MISAKSYEKSWIQQVASGLAKSSDPKLIEKIIFAFSLLENLRLSGLELIFKGGTSVFLISDPPRRFSIDVDIIVSDSPEKLALHFNDVIKSGLFLNWQDDHERKSSENVPVIHYKFYYKSNVDSHFGDEPILLDVLFSSKSVYPKTNHIPINHKWLITEEPLTSVLVPSIESILGDKLTAFAPNTTGILYSKNRPVEIIKQLYDIAYLFDKAEDFQEVKESFLNVVSEEIEYRNTAITYQNVLQDAFETALLITMRDHASVNFNFLQKGISNIFNFIISPFRIEDAIICASKVAYLTQINRQDSIPLIARYKSPADITTFSITQAGYEKLNRMKKMLPEAFFYWYHAIKLL